MNSEILILTSRDDFYGKYFQNAGFKVENIWSNNHFSSRKYNILKFFNKEYLLYGFSKALIKKYDRIIITQTNAINSITKDIKRWNGNAIVKYWLWDPIKDYPKGRIEELFESMRGGVDCYSFDKNDCSKYGLKYNNQLYLYYDYSSDGINDELKKSTVFFIGANKGRIDRLVEIRDVLNKNNISYQFYVLQDEKLSLLQHDNIEILTRPMKYENIIRKINESECILDIVQEGQSGLTWRPFEALFYNKKLITTNKDIKEFDFYNKNNILVLEDNYDEIKDFLDLPYIEVDEKIKDNYRIEKWINNFFKK